MKLRHLLFICIFIFMRQSINSQTTDDFGIWTTIGVEKSLGEKWSLLGDVDFRTREDSREIARWAIKLGTEYNIMKKLKIAVFYHFQSVHNLEHADFQPKHRFFTYLQGKQMLGRFSFILRERLQLTYKDESGHISGGGKVEAHKINPDWYWRNKLRIEYDIRESKLKPSASIESFFQLNNPDGNEFDMLRYTLTMGYKFNRHSMFNLSAIHDHEMNIRKPVNKYVVELGYVYSF